MVCSCLFVESSAKQHRSNKWERLPPMQAVDRVIKCGQYIHMLLALLRRNHESHSGSAGSAWLMCPTLIHLFTEAPQFLPHISSGSKTPQQYDSYSYSYPTYTCTGYLHVFVYDSANMHAVPVSLSRLRCWLHRRPAIRKHELVPWQ